jgi:hypothetical protein
VGACHGPRFHLTPVRGVNRLSGISFFMDTRMGSAAGLKNNKGKLGVLAVYVLVVFVSPLTLLIPLAQT